MKSAQFNRNTYNNKSLDMAKTFVVMVNKMNGFRFKSKPSICVLGKGVEKVNSITCFNSNTHICKYRVFESRSRSQLITRIYNNSTKLVTNEFNEYIYTTHNNRSVYR